MHIKGEMKLTEQVVRSFRVAKVFKENTDRINNIDFSPSGDTLISSSEDDQIVIYDCEKGTWVKEHINSHFLFPNLFPSTTFADKNELSTVKNMELIWSILHMQKTQPFMHQQKLMVSLIIYLINSISWCYLFTFFRHHPVFIIARQQVHSVFSRPH